MINYKLYQDDCLKIMKQIPDKSIDLIVTDPPFGLPDDLPIDDVIVRLIECNRISKRMIILMDWRNFWRVDKEFHSIKIGELIWEYGWISGGRTKAKCGYFPTHNTIGLYGNKQDFKFVSDGSIIKRQPGFSSPRQCSFAKKSGHPYEKPIKLMEYLILNSSIECETILDPFMGSGSTGIACINTNRNFIGIELDEKYFQIAKERLESCTSSAVNSSVNNKLIDNNNKSIKLF